MGFDLLRISHLGRSEISVIGKLSLIIKKDENILRARMLT